MSIETEGAGKSDTPRPVNGDKFRTNWEEIFRKGKPECKGNSDPWFPRPEPTTSVIFDANEH